MENKNILILEDIRSSHNVGTFFRTADGAGIQKIFLIGTTPTPINRFGLQNNKISKTALGAEKNIKYEYRQKTKEVIEELKKEYDVISIENSEKSIKYTEYKKNKPIAFIFGNEVDGISKETLKNTKTHLQIPMLGKKESLNVSVAAGIIIYHFLQ